MRKKVSLILGTVILTVVLTASLLVPAMAETANPATTPETGKTSLVTELVQKVAKILNITPEQLTNAFKQASLEIVDEGQKAGKFTEDQATKMKDRINQSVQDGKLAMPMPFGNIRGGKAPMAGPMDRMKGGVINHMEIIAQELGMTIEDLMTAMRSGKSLTDIIAEKNINLDSLKAKIVAAQKDAINKMVTDGKLTQAQADKMLEGIDNMVNKLFEAKQQIKMGMDKMSRFSKMPACDCESETN